MATVLNKDVATTTLRVAAGDNARSSMPKFFVSLSVGSPLTHIDFLSLLGRSAALTRRVRVLPDYI